MIKSEKLQIRLSALDRKCLEQLAQQNKMTLSDCLRWCLREQYYRKVGLK